MLTKHSDQIASELMKGTTALSVLGSLGIIMLGISLIMIIPFLAAVWGISALGIMGHGPAAHLMVKRAYSLRAKDRPQLKV